MRIAVQGCCHGELDRVFKTVQRMNSRNKIDLLIILGDFQSIRKPKDFKSISIPPKYQKLGDFHKYYSRNTPAPVPTIFIGGNHESMRHLMLLPYGGYAGKRIYYLGYSNVIWFKGVRIASLSGIWKEWDVDKARPSWEEMESCQWQKNIRSLYHVRKTDILPLMTIKKPLSLMLSHDWPNEITKHGDVAGLLKKKPFFKKDIQNDNLGSPANWKLLQRLRPEWWLSAHLHVRFQAEVDHTTSSEGPLLKKNSDEIDLDMSSDEETASHECPTHSNESTKFLALDKCLPGRQFLEVIEVEADESHPSFKTTEMYWDEEFISNLRYLEKNREALEDKPFSEIELSSLENTADDSGYPPISPHDLIVPRYEYSIQKREKDQTNYFIEKFLTLKDQTNLSNEPSSEDVKKDS
ncbi:RNA lariat debranching enzyme KNAG_0F02810 [Huiozyma naganishii CBS 8797]|uniref:Lariat debranching enzyme C-terminal domain-containing protein n=1 Tax=Huiozyma naganishii (strain ATCC MYA-139 / BCRC 22969 / CBS 8797 / KCTC 17520 / NBRC 10181 / NCYC 3082 / Yp74L-3) TaxID=1071383 RepID=J7RN09_HUIN7|nr:hypothetical protein KNAG_0F02810 [Kazachstania naganishii CBS 8797]CCK70943.1 hypothetical protein KNAG_0F02810 [Kazachstania naganishii CBS 8797]